MALPSEKESLSYAQYLLLGADIRYEVIDGKIYNMSPSPTPRHQDVVTQLSVEFGLFLRGKKCRVFVSPIDVCLSDERDLYEVKEWVSPDLVVVCDKSRIGNKRIVGSPDLVIEVLSPSTAKNDKLIKYNRYERAGIKEYWIVDPTHKTVDVYLLDNGSYTHNGTYFKEDVISVSIFESCSIELNQIFRDEDY
ncbi:Uma2 family endonuclease [Bacillus sp. FJAT-29937]|uniref:Uma2 family endonuclease n=1 Tax=Bacillus sp. FJAT-29937 TaxID=1720553 RepID=UPI0008321A36|nr:Uma2 family endonuclease [Bacillus sp. FJAT-29937]